MIKQIKAFLAKGFSFWSNGEREAMKPIKPTIYSVEAHPIRNRQISKNSMTVIQRLNRAGFNAYLVGGGVRDLLLGLSPKDFDIVTDAHPNEIRKLFRNSRIIGRRFRLVHVLFGREVVEVATFRSNEADDRSKHYQTNQEGFVTRDNIYGDIDEDAMRRDFTINALFYDVRDQTIIDYCGGFADMQKRQLRLIGNPAERFLEDPVRILRAIRFEAKLGFQIDPALLSPIAEHRQLLENVSPARMYDEVLKLFLTGHGEASYERLMAHELFEILFPLTYRALAAQGFPEQHLLRQSLHNSDLRAKEGLSSSPYFVYGSLLWEPFITRFNALTAQGVKYRMASEQAIEEVFKIQHQITVIPRYVREFIEALWVLQFKLEAKVIHHPEKLMAHPRFKAAYDFLLLRAEAQESEAVIARADYWRGQFTRFEAAQLADEQQRNREERREVKQALKNVVNGHDDSEGVNGTAQKKRPSRRRSKKAKTDNHSGENGVSLPATASKSPAGHNSSAEGEVKKKRKRRSRKRSKPQNNTSGE